MKKYYNIHEFKQAVSIIQKNPFLAKDLFEKYLQKYPRDYCAYPSYIYTLVMLDELDKASEVLEYVENRCINDIHFQNKSGSLEEYKKRIILAKMRVLFRKEEYQLIYDLYLNSKILLEEEYYQAIYYVKSQLGLLNDDSGKQTYIYNQIVDYSEDEFKEHIKHHQFDYNVNQFFPNDLIFVYDFDVNMVIDEVKKYIPSKKRLCHGLFTDAYIFKYDRCGRDNNKIVDYFKVISFMDSDKLITMYPQHGCEQLPHVDLNYLAGEKPKVKTISQIDKFNRRYRRN